MGESCGYSSCKQDNYVACACICLGGCTTTDCPLFVYLYMIPDDFLLNTMQGGSLSISHNRLMWLDVRDRYS